MIVKPFKKSGRIIRPRLNQRSRGDFYPDPTLGRRCEPEKNRVLPPPLSPIPPSVMPNDECRA